MVPPASIPQIALTIAGHDPSSGAGITADLATFAAHGLFGLSSITALTIQSTLGVRESAPVSAEMLRKTLICLAEDTPPAGIKIGMLGSAENVQVIADFLRQLPSGTPIVLDPVLVSSSGRELLSNEGLDVLRSELLPLVSWITPNRSELNLLRNGKACESRAEIEQAARDLASNLPNLGIIVTGGDAEKPEDFVLTQDGEGNWLTGEHIQTTATHGTGCAFSSAMLANLLAGKTALNSATAAKAYVTTAMQTASRIGQGKGPMNLLWALKEPSVGR